MRMSDTQRRRSVAPFVLATAIFLAPQLFAGADEPTMALVDAAGRDALVASMSENPARAPQEALDAGARGVGYDPSRAAMVDCAVGRAATHSSDAVTTSIPGRVAVRSAECFDRSGL